MRLIDSHCHLNYEGLVERQGEVLENARERGVTGFLNISTRQREWPDIIAASAEKLLTLIDAGEGGAPIAQPTPLFPRLELEEEEAA